MATKVVTENMEMTMDEILLTIGEFGKYQILLEIAFCFIKIPSSMASLLPYFVQHNPGWQCAFNSTICKLNGTISTTSKLYRERCKMPRSEWEFTKPKDYSVVTQFNLVCEMEPYNLLATSLFFILWAFGAVVLGGIADRYGRKIVLIPSTAAIIIIGFVSAFSPNFAFYAVARAIVGFFIPGNTVQLFVLMSEFAGPKKRPLAGIIILFAFTLGTALLGLLAYFIRTWKVLMIVCTAPYFVFFIFCKFIPESTRWLCLHGREDESMRIIRRIAKVNGKDLPDVKLAQVPVHSEQTGNILNLFRPTKMAVGSLIQGFAWFFIAMVYYGVSFAAADLGGNMYRDYILVCLVEIPAVPLAIYLCQKIGRRKTVLIPTTVGGISCIAASLIPTDQTYSDLIPVRVFLGILGKLCISISYDSLYTWSFELFPTVIRSAAMGFMQIAARLGSSLAPWVAKWLIGIHVVLPFSLMGGLAIICALLLLKLPETAFKPTAETFEDLKKNDNIIMKDVVVDENVADKNVENTSLLVVKSSNM